MIASQNISVNDVEQVVSLIASAVPDMMKGQVVPDSLSISQKLCKQCAKPVIPIYIYFFLYIHMHIYGASQVAQWVKNLPAMQELQ